MEPIIPKSSISIFDFKNCTLSEDFHTFMLVLQNGTIYGREYGTIYQNY